MNHYCLICRRELQEGDKLIGNVFETITWKPADVPDALNAATASTQDLATSRQEHKKTVLAERFMDYRGGVLPSEVLNVRHAACSVPRTSASGGDVQPRFKHLIRYNRSAVRKR